MPYTWSKIAAPFLPRSSHSISVIGTKAYIFGGEIKPREPVDNALHVIDIHNGEYQTIAGKGEVPDPRVGHVAATIGDNIYIFGGRGGAAMTPLEESSSLFRFSTTGQTWKKLSPSTPGPCARSYHCATSTSDAIIIHAGCGDASTGRLRDTWSFNINTNEWTQLADAPGDPRGGASIAHYQGKIFRFGGFNGKTEMGGGIDVLDLSAGLQGDWKTVPFGASEGAGRHAGNTMKKDEAGPGARSVCGLHVFGDQLISVFGEGKPSHTGGHDAAGNFWDDVWSFSPDDSKWIEVEQGGGEKLEARGWFSSCESEVGIVLWGGINAANDRLGDGWILSRRT